MSDATFPSLHSPMRSCNRIMAPSRNIPSVKSAKYSNFDGFMAPKSTGDIEIEQRALIVSAHSMTMKMANGGFHFP